MQPVPIISGQMCELCGKNLLIKSGRFGEFLACEGYPECKNTKPIIKRIGLKCFNPGCEGDIIQKISRKGKVFYGCSNYPKCKFTSAGKPLAEKCPTCGQNAGWGYVICRQCEEKFAVELLQWHVHCNLASSRIGQHHRGATNPRAAVGRCHQLSIDAPFALAAGRQGRSVDRR